MFKSSNLKLFNWCELNFQNVNFALASAPGGKLGCPQNCKNLNSEFRPIVNLNNFQQNSPFQILNQTPPINVLLKVYSYLLRCAICETVCCIFGRKSLKRLSHDHAPLETVRFPQKIYEREAILVDT